MKIKAHKLLLPFAIGFFILINDAMGLTCFKSFCSKNPKDTPCAVDFKEKDAEQKECSGKEFCHLRVLATKHLATGEVENIAETRDCAPAKPEYSCEGKRLGAPTADDETLKTDCICDTDLCNGAHHEMDHMEYDGGVTKNPRVDTVVRNGAPRTTATFIIAAMVIFSSALFQLVI